METHLGICEICGWWNSLDGDTGQCRRYAPKHFLSELGNEDEKSTQDDGIWPFTDHNDWCGEFINKPNRKVNMSVKAEDLLKKRCEICEYFKDGYYAGSTKQHPGEPGLCVRHSPFILTGNVEGWPPVTKYDWCGDFERDGIKEYNLTKKDLTDERGL